MASVREEGRRLKKSVAVDKGAIQSHVDHVAWGSVEQDTPTVQSQSSIIRGNPPAEMSSAS